MANAMPRVPSYQPGQVAPREVTGARLRPANNNGGVFGAIGEGLQELGGTMGAVAEEQDRLNAENDDTQARLITAEAGSAFGAATSEYEQLKAGQAREAQGAYNERLSSIREQALSRAGNPRQRRLLEDRLVGLHGASAAQVASHAVREQRAERETGFRAQEASYAELAAGATDPVLRDRYIASGAAVVRDRLAQVEGLNPDVTPEAFALAELDFTTKVHEATLNRMFATPDPSVDEIMDYVEAYGDEMTAALRADTMERLQDPLQGRMARSDADMAMGLFEPVQGEAPATTGSVAASGAPGAVAGVLSGAGWSAPVVAGFLGNFEVEGGYSGSRGDGGQAAGIAQWHPDRQANFRRVIGKPVERSTHAEQANFVVWEMNNPGAAGMSVAERDAILGARTPEQAAALIDEHYERSSGQHRTQREAAARRYGGGDYANAPREWDRSAMEAALNQAAEKNGWTPERTQRARAEMERRIDRDEALLQDERNEADEAVTEWVQARGDSFTSTSMIPRDMWNRLSPADRMAWDRVAGANQSARAPNANGDTAISLNLMRFYNPAEFATLNLGKYVGQVTPAELDTLLQQQAKARTEGEGWSPRSGITTALTFGAKINGVDYEPEEEAAILQIMEAEAQRLYRENGNKPLTETDYGALYRSATRNVRTSTSFLGIGTGGSERPRYQLTLGMMPDATRTRLTQAFYRQFGRDPKPDELLRLYRVDTR